MCAKPDSFGRLQPKHLSSNSLLEVQLPTSDDVLSPAPLLTGSVHICPTLRYFTSIHVHLDCPLDFVTPSYSLHLQYYDCIISGQFLWKFDDAKKDKEGHHKHLSTCCMSSIFSVKWNLQKAAAVADIHIAHHLPIFLSASPNCPTSLEAFSTCIRSCRYMCCIFHSFLKCKLCIRYCPHIRLFHLLFCNLGHICHV